MFLLKSLVIILLASSLINVLTCCKQSRSGRRASQAEYGLFGDLAPYRGPGLRERRINYDGQLLDERRSRRIREKRDFSSKTLVGSPYDTKDQAKFPTSGSIKSHKMKDTVLRFNHES